MPSCIHNVCSSLLKYCNYYKKTEEWCDCALKNYEDRCETEGLEIYAIFVPIILLLCLLTVILSALLRCRAKKEQPPPIYEQPPTYKEEETV